MFYYALVWFGLVHIWYGMTWGVLWQVICEQCVLLGFGVVWQLFFNTMFWYALVWYCVWRVGYHGQMERSLNIEQYV